MFTNNFLLLRPLALVAFLALAGFGLVACDDGPAEEAGEAVDDAVDDAGDAVEDATN